MSNLGVDARILAAAQLHVKLLNIAVMSLDVNESNSTFPIVSAI